MVRAVKQVILFFAVFSLPLSLCGYRLLAQNTTDATKNYHDLNPGLQVSFSKQVAPIFQAKCVTLPLQDCEHGRFRSLRF